MPASPSHAPCPDHSHSPERIVRFQSAPPEEQAEEPPERAKRAEAPDLHTLLIPSLMQRRSTLSEATRLRAKSWKRTRQEALMELTGQARGAVEIDDLEGMGYTTSHLASVIYDKVQMEQQPNFLKHIRIDPDGGIDRIEEAWYPEKRVWFVVLLASVLFNVASVLALNWTLAQSYVNEHMPTKGGGLMGEEGLAASPGHVDAGLQQETVDMFQHIHSARARSQFLTVAVVVAFFEVGWVFASVVQASLALWTFASRSSKEFEAYTALGHFFQTLLPRFATFSSISLAAMVHPSIIYHDYTDMMARWEWRSSPSGRAAFQVRFAVVRVLCLATAVLSFTIKLVATALKLISPQYGALSCVAGVLALLNQCMGCVNVEHLLQGRIYLFVFGGHDTDYQDDERALRSVYKCRLTREIWAHFWERGERLRAIILLATLDHIDLQKLLIEDVEPASLTASHAATPHTGSKCPTPVSYKS